MPERAVPRGARGRRRSSPGTLLAKTAARGGRHAGHHRRSAARHGDLRGAAAARPGHDGRGGRHRPARRAEARQAASIYVAAGGRGGQADRARRSSTSCRRASTCACTTGDRVKEGDPLVVGPLVPHDILKISGIEAVQDYLVQRGAGGLPQPARGHRRQAHRDHRRADAAQGEGRRRAATRACCRAA